MGAEGAEDVLVGASKQQGCARVLGDVHEPQGGTQPMRQQGGRLGQGSGVGTQRGAEYDALAIGAVSCCGITATASRASRRTGIRCR